MRRKPFRTIHHLLVKLTDFPTNIFSYTLVGKPFSSTTIRKIVFIIRKIIFPLIKIVFVTNFVTLVRKFVTRVTKFLIYVSKFVINFLCADGENYHGLRKNFLADSKNFLP